MNFTGRRTKRLPRLATEKLSQPSVRQAYQEALHSELSLSCPNDTELQWNRISATMHDAGASACGTISRHRTSHWISERSVNLLEARRHLPAGSEHNVTRRAIRRELKRSLRADKEAWWTSRAQEMEEAGAVGNYRKLFQLIRTTGPRKPGVSETIRDSAGALIHNKERRMARWAEHFEHQFSWPPAPGPLPTQVMQDEPWTVSLEPPSEAEVRNAITALNRFRAAGPDSLPPALFKDGGEVLCKALTSLFERIWNEESVPANWSESIIVAIYKKGSRTDCANHRGISLTPVVTKLLASIIVRRLTAERESRIREEQAGFRPGRGCIDHIFTLRQVLEQRHAYRRPTIAVFLDFKSAFDSVDRSILFEILARKGVPTKYVNILRALYSNTRGRVRVYGALSDSFSTTSGVRQGCPISPFLFNFVVDSIMECSLAESHDVGVEVLPGERLVDLDYADDIVLLFDNVEAAQSTLNSLSRVVPLFGMHFAPSKCKVLLQDHQPLDDPLTLANEELEVVDQFTYLGSCISNDGRIETDVSSRIAKARAAFLNLRHLWRQKGVSLRLKGRVYKATVRAVLLYGSETWPLRSEDLRRLQVFDHRCLRSIAGVGWHQRVRNDDVRRRVLGGDDHASSLEQQIALNKLRWLGHVLRMPGHRLPRRALFSLPGVGWRKARGGQKLTWQREMKSLTTKLGAVGPSRLPGWSPRDSPCAWLETLQDMARNRHQWRVCCRLLIGLSV
ncbi:unnamed protein product [Dicrocoelium dendriticum]|nr:unnamed protein product [Dicrocoelium dendriticum]